MILLLNRESECDVSAKMTNRSIILQRCEFMKSELIRTVTVIHKKP